MNFAIDEEHQMLKDLVARFVREQLLPLEAAALAREAQTGQLTVLEEDRLRLDAMSKKLGLWGLDAPEEMGGSNLPVTAMVGVNEEMGKSILPYELPPDSPNLVMLLRSANDRQRATYLDPYARGETHSAIAISEPGAGTDPAALTTRAVRAGDDWVINGRKIWISRADSADWTIVMAVTDKAAGKKGISAFVVPTKTPGYTVARIEDKLGQHASDTAQILFDNCRVPVANLLGEEGMGLKIALSGLEGGRIGIASQAVGMARAAFEAALAYSKDRKSFGQPIFQHQAVQFKLADMATQIEVARQMIHHAASLKDAGRPCLKEAAMAKLFASEMAERVCSDAIQVFGGYGYVSDFPVERIYRDVRVCQIYEGTSEVQKILIGRALA